MHGSYPSALLRAVNHHRHPCIHWDSRASHLKRLDICKTFGYLRYWQATMTGFLERHNSIYTYIPNLIGAALLPRAHTAPHGMCINVSHPCLVLATWPFSTVPWLNAGYARIACALYAFSRHYTQPNVPHAGSCVTSWMADLPGCSIRLPHWVLC